MLVERVSSTTTTPPTSTPTTTPVRSVGLARRQRVSVAHILPGMPHSLWCQHCLAHRSKFRRLCNACGRWVAPGCDPEHCLVRDAKYGEHRFSICRSCFEDRHRRLLRGTARRLNLVMDLVLERGF